MCRLAEYLWKEQAEMGRGAKIDHQRFAGAVDELMGIWRICIGGNLANISLGGDDDAIERALASVATLEDDWTFLPAASVFASWHERNSPTAFEQMLGLLVPDAVKRVQRKSPLRTDYASAAIIIVDLLKTTLHTSADGHNVPMATLPRYAPFVALIDGMLAVASSPRVPPFLATGLASRDDLPRVKARMKAMLARIGCQGADTLEPSAGSREAARTPVDSPSPEGIEGSSGQVNNAAEQSAVERYTAILMHRLWNAMRGKQVTDVASIVREVHVHALTRSAGEVLPLKLYELMLLASLSLRDTRTAVEIWHNMAELGVKPTIRTYTAMMRGSQNARDVKGLETFFGRMRQAGIQPDGYTWSIRIFALLKLRTVKSGLRALSQMGHEWFAAAKAKALSEKKQVTNNKNLAAELVKMYPGDVDGVPRPSLTIMNSAMAALATARPSEVPKVFRWGRTFDIEPDLNTFNTLISVFLKQQRHTDALQVLQKMQEHGLQTDTTTWTVILQSLLEGGFLDKLSPAEQQTRILAYIDSIYDRSANFSGINTMGYALVIDRLLKWYQNDSAAAAVYSHMLSKGRKPTSHIYTILVTSYFERQPQPDFFALETIWRQIQDSHPGAARELDTIFFDRMIEGYAQNHHLVGIRPMETFLAACREAGGKKPGWKALESVARVYAERRMWGKLRSLVDEAMIAMRDQQGRMSKLGEASFWDFVHSTTLLEGEGYLSRAHFALDRPVGSPLERAEAAMAVKPIAMLRGRAGGP
jgi:pentatricopeptide repeat protein